MHRTLRHLAWASAFFVGCAGAHSAATSNVCGDGAEHGVIRFQFSDRQLGVYAECIKQQTAECGGGSTGSATSARGEQGEATPDCRPQYCSELALNLPAHSLNGPVCTPFSCGVVDDAWGRAAHMASDYCAAQPPVGTAQAQVTAPATFLDVSQHHVLYQSSQGLVGVCVQCAAASGSAAGH